MTITRRKTNRLLWPLFGLGLALLLAALAYPRLHSWGLERIGHEAQGTLRLSADGLQGAIEQFEPLPSLIAERPILQRMLQEPGNTGLLPYVNEQLRLTAFSIGASDVFLMDISGTTIAASSYRRDAPFIGRNFSYRPYFTQALDGGLGRFFALGTTSGERGLYFAAPVLSDTRVVGVVAVKFLVDPFEAAWRDGTTSIIVRDVNGIVFMSSEDNWLFRTTAPLEDDAITWLEQTRQYPLDRLSPLTIDPQSSSMLTISDDGSATDYVSTTERISSLGLTMTVLAPAGPARVQALFILSGAGLIALSATAVWAAIRQRRARLRERLATQTAIQTALEHRVTERTAELSEANALLKTEVQERTTAETQLRDTQTQLIQAGKLAALGQMSAALSHEINQPLAAVKSYADNATAFLDRDRTAEARDNLRRISDMTDRMASISTHLRNFARRPKQAIGPLRLNAAVQDALAVCDVRIKAEGAVVDYRAPNHDVWVIGGHVRLQQVIVNLINNALDAMAGQDNPTVRLTIEDTTLSVYDTGPGISDQVADEMFDPFFTTKGPGHGLGLGLSISYNIVRDFGGNLIGANGPGGGAVFRLTLDPTQARQRPPRNE